MSTDAQIVSFVREDRRISLRAQKKAASDRGIRKVYEDWALCIRQRRAGSGDVIAVKRLYLVADPSKARAKGGMRQSLVNRMAEAETAGAMILEMDTDRRTSKPAEKYAMLNDALDVLAQTRNRSKRIGRPPLKFSDDQMTIMRLHWKSMEHRTNEIAQAAIAADGVKVSIQALTRLLGPSGRKPGTTGPRPPKPVKRKQK